MRSLSIRSAVGQRLLRWGTVLLQVTALWLLANLCDVFAGALRLPIPGSIIGCLLLFVLLQLRLVRVSWLERGANFLLAQMLLFFVPSAVGIIQYRQLMWNEGWRLIFTILLSTVLVMTVTGKLADWVEGRKAGRLRP
jgi:holin-like protein